MIIFTFLVPTDPPAAAASKPNSAEQKTSNSERGGGLHQPGQADTGAPEWKPNSSFHKHLSARAASAALACVITPLMR